MSAQNSRDCDGHVAHEYEPPRDDCDFCGHPHDEHEDGFWEDDRHLRPQTESRPTEPVDA